MGMAKPDAKTVLSAGEIDPRPVQPSAVATEAEIRATNVPGEQKGRQSLHVACVRENIESR